MYEVEVEYNDADGWVATWANEEGKYFATSKISREHAMLELGIVMGRLSASQPGSCCQGSSAGAAAK